MFTSDYNYEAQGFNITFKSLGCPAGKYINEEYLCVPCPAGTANSKIDQDHCVTCEAGFHAKQGSTECSMCNVGEYQPNANSEECIRCPQHTTTLLYGALSILDCSCAEGYYSIGAKNGASCLPCPEGAFCVNNTAFALPRYWNSEQDPYNFLKCSSSKSCPGAVINTNSKTCRINCCGDNRAGEMCSVCVPGYYSKLGECHGIGRTLIKKLMSSSVWWWIRGMDVSVHYCINCHYWSSL